jgi:DNA polymerase-3 subunit chi
MSSCQVDFYQIDSAGREPAALACRLALMAWERGHRVAIISPDEQSAMALDQLLWEQPEQRFVPHGRSGSPEAVGAAVTITIRAPNGAADVVINLADQALSDVSRCKRLLEIVPFDEHQRQAARTKYKAYLAQGVKPNLHKIN